MAYTAVPTSIAGDTLTAAWQNTYIRDNLAWIAAAGISGWAAYTPTWTASGTAPAIGNGVYTASYCQLGKLVIARFKMTAGSTSTFGTGIYYWALPVTAQAAILGGAAGVILDSGTTFYTTSMVLNNTTTVKGHMHNNGTEVGQTNPMTWATGDWINAFLVYEAA